MNPTVHSKPVVYNSSENDEKETVARKIWHWIEATRVYSKIYNFFCRLKRSWAYAKFGWSNYDFDGAYALAALNFKLKRVQRVLTSSHLVQDKTTLQSLRLVIRLLDRLVEDDYSYFLDRHNIKWHATKYPECGFEDTEDGLCRMVFPGENLPIDQQEQEREEHVAAWDADETARNRDKRWAFSILEKYYSHWWD